MKVKFFSTNDDGTQKEIGEAVMENGEVVLRGLPGRLAKTLQIDGIPGKGGKTLFPADGKKFLERLQVEFSGSRLRASDIIKD